MLSRAPLPAVEQGWSDGLDRKLWRFLARRAPARRVALAGPCAVASLTFDDVPDSAATVGAPLLERRGVAGTFYVAAEWCGRRDRHWRVAGRSEIRAVARAGHEIGCHTARHVNVQSLGLPELARECDRSRDLLIEICGQDPRHFCYPFGDLGLSQKRYLAGRFATCRSIYESPNLGRIDPALLGAVGLFDAGYDRERLAVLVRRTVEARGWLILYTHDVAAEPTPIGASPRILDEALTLLADHGVPVLTMSDAARHHGLLPRD
ncbi:polysaccharide deacetylase family protein [Methylobacterium nigriterrae]|uniref:polysaccharide deacetylase family protein n=1 Tax=Methylobacterium nigriterrae TaxID=3127512 RepID=UPI0030137F30